MRYSLCRWTIRTSVQCDKCSTTCLYSFLHSLNKPGLGVLLRSLALILQAVEALEEWYDLIGTVFSEGQEPKEWLSEVRAWQMVSQLGKEVRELSQGDHLVEFYYMLKCMLFFHLTVNKKGKINEQRNTKYSTNFWNKTHFNSSIIHRPGSLILLENFALLLLVRPGFVWFLPLVQREEWKQMWCISYL